MQSNKKLFLNIALALSVLFNVSYASSYPIPKEERQSDADGRLDIKKIFTKNKTSKKQIDVKNENKDAIWNLALNILSKHGIEILDHSSGLIVTNTYKDNGCEYKAYVLIGSDNHITCNVLKKSNNIFVKDIKKSSSLASQLNYSNKGIK